jgi:hypothetical protein
MISHRRWFAVNKTGHDSKVFEMPDMPAAPRRPIHTKLIETAVGHPFAWQATFGEWDLGDPIGVGPDEQSAILDLQMESDYE